MDISQIGTNPEYTAEVIDNSKLGKNEFLKILAAQLKFQDPMEGSDNSAYIAQLAQFSELEQMENLNSSFDELKTNQNILYGTFLIGKVVNIAFGDVMISGVVDRIKLSNSMLKLIVNDREFDIADVDSFEENKEVIEQDISAVDEEVVE